MRTLIHSDSLFRKVRQVGLQYKEKYDSGTAEFDASKVVCFKCEFLCNNALFYALFYAKVGYD